MAFALGPEAAANGYRLVAYETIGSTSSEALARAKAGDRGRLWIVSREQTTGHGRRGRPWQTPAGNLAASLFLALRPTPAHAATLGFVAGLALVEAIGEVAGQPSPPCGGRVAGPQDRLGGGFAVERQASLSPAPSRFAATPSPQGGGGLSLKWPNDVLLGGAKVAGILLEAATRADGPDSVVIGIGVNVEHAPEGLPYPTTSLAACGVQTTAEQLFETLSETWVAQEKIWDEGRGFPEIRRRWLASATGLGAPITVRLGDEVLRGTFETIDEEGMLVVRAANGSARRVAAGDVHFGAAASAVG